MSEIKVSTFDGALAELDVDVLLLPVFEAADSAGPWESLDEAVEGRISEAIASRPFSGKLQKYLAVPLPTGGGPGEILLVGLGEAGKLTSFRYREAISGGTSLAVRRRAERIAIAAREDAKFGAEHAAAATEAVLLSQYRFDRYKKPDEDATRLAELLLPADDGVDEVIERTRCICRAVAWARDNIQVNAIIPGWITTDMTSGIQTNEAAHDRIVQRTPAGRSGTPAECAGAAVFLASSASDFVTGVSIPVDGGYAIM